MADCLKGDNFRVLEKALSLFRPPSCFDRINPSEMPTVKNGRAVNDADVLRRKAVHMFVRPLFRDGVPFWNPTVARWTANVLDQLRLWSEEAFAEAASALISAKKSMTRQVTRRHTHIPKEAGAAAIPPSRSLMARNSMTKMPPRVGKLSLSNPRPPRPVDLEGRIMVTRIPSTTGCPATVFPRSMTSDAMSAAATTSTSTSKSITRVPSAVAPWASVPPRSHNEASSRNNGSSHQDSKSADEAPDRQICADGILGDVSISAFKSQGLDQLVSYIARCRPDGTCGKDSVEASEARWSSQTAAPTPTRLPNLKFHDLVFGRVLGTGAFSTVRYAKRIASELGLRQSGQSHWPTYAVKIISAELMREKGYEPNVAREIGTEDERTIPPRLTNAQCER